VSLLSGLSAGILAKCITPALHTSPCLSYCAPQTPAVASVLSFDFPKMKSSQERGASACASLCLWRGVCVCVRGRGSISQDKGAFKTTCVCKPLPSVLDTF
jgi:hypothetical protein